MEVKIILSEDLLNYLFQQEAQKLVGKIMKRFELTDNKELIKKEVKELIYENLRDIRDILILNGKEGIKLTKKE